LDEFEIIRIDSNGVKNLFLYKKFSDGPHLSFAGHIDVVPAGEGWNSEPFEPTIADGFLYGRGASDMKSGLAAFLNALKSTKDFKGTLSAMLTSDEEGDARYGTIEILKHISSQNLLPDFCIVAEPTSEKTLGDTMKIGRRGSINGTITITGRGGHAAYPAKAINPISLAGKLISKIADKQLDNGDEFFAPSQLVITDVRGGYQKTNVIPTELSMMFNVRNSTKTTVDDIRKFINMSFLESGIEKYELTMEQSSKPFVAKDDAKTRKIISILQDIISKETGESPQLSTSGGTSDARFAAEFGIGVLEFGPPNETIHAPNECVAIAELEKLELIFKEFIELYQIQ
jgi:succinyl-diaminopimelate desuccinylase